MVLLSSIFLDNPMKFRGLNRSSCLLFKKKRKKNLTQAGPPGHTPRAVPDSARIPKRHRNQLTPDKRSGENGGDGVSSWTLMSLTRWEKKTKDYIHNLNRGSFPDLVRGGRLSPETHELITSSSERRVR